MSTARLDFQNHRLASLALAALFVVSMTNSLRSASDRVDEMLHGDQYVSEPFHLNIQTLQVIEVRTAAERAGLRQGDIIVGVNGQPVQGLSDIYGPIRRARIGDHLLLHVKRQGAADSIEEDIPVPLRRLTYVGYAPGSAAYVATLLSRILTPLFCLALGFWVAAVRVGDRSAWALLFLLLSLANLILDDPTIYGNEGVLQPVLTGLSGLFLRLGPLALVYFGIIFPETLTLDRKFPWIKWVLIGPMLVRAGLLGIADGLLLHHLDIVAPLWPLLWGPVGSVGLYIEMGLIGFFS
jgi:sigma-B regulation protein RsbU (phosphoserine phosphatase)